VDDYVQLGATRMYYEVAGEDEPMVLLHGGFGGVHVWTGQVPTLAKRYRVNVPEQRGRGHSPDVEGPITYQGLADDAAPASSSGSWEDRPTSFGPATARRTPSSWRRQSC
jgi:pimeloyl-ACP methyl ester carboxylesterase